MRLKLEIVGGVILVALLCLVGYEQVQKMVQVRVAAITAQHDREADAKLDSKKKQMDDENAQRVKADAEKAANLQKMTPQQIVVKLPQYVPQATEPVHVLTPEEIATYNRALANDPIQKAAPQMKSGDAIVPQADIKPIAQALLDGNKCSADLAYCNANQDIWQDKYKLKSDEAKQWESAAKGGSPLIKTFKCIGARGAVGAGSGAAFASDKRTGAIGGFGIGAVSCFFFKP